MLFKFKILISDGTSSSPKIMGMFGDCIKIRLNILTLNHNSNHTEKSFVNFIAHNLCIPQELVKVKYFNVSKNIFEVYLPDGAYEIIMSEIES